MNKREKITSYLIDLISTGQLKKGDKIPSEYMLADIFSVNTKTANLAVSSLVSTGILKRLAGAAGTIVARHGSYPRGIITYLTTLATPFNFWAELLHGAQKAAFIHGYLLQYIECEPREIKTICSRFTDYNVSGLLTSGYGSIDTQNFPFPIIHVDWLPPKGSSCNYVTSDNFSAGYLITKHLQDLNHKDIVFVIEPANFSLPTIDERKNGFAKALEESGISTKDRIFHSNSNNAVTIKEIKRRFPNCTGVVFDSDISAISMINYLQDKGFQIPEDFSIAACGALTKHMPVMRITSVEQFPEDMGLFACNELINLIEGKRTTPVAEKLPVELFIGQSVMKLQK